MADSNPEAPEARPPGHPPFGIIACRLVSEPGLISKGSVQMPCCECRRLIWVSSSSLMMRAAYGEGQLLISCLEPCAYILKDRYEQ